MTDPRIDLELHGFSIVPRLLNEEEMNELCDAISAAQEGESVRKKSGVYAIRNLLSVVPSVARIAESQKITTLARSALGTTAIAVRGTLFDKTPDANWLVPWHQDLTISVKERLEAAGYGPWTVKAGVNSVQPPAGILDAMVAVRIHLDDCHERNGALRVLPGTHRYGRLTSEQVERAQQQIAPVTCSIARGGAVLMKPLVLHTSSAADNPSRRRVIHIDFASCDLPHGLKWFTE
jgi:ectoine hydroxylase-related dioxygenase (phytanoyl-CoA dioxygenase family)